jgi:TRAP-type C4-dicarboxylate transport system substrate-binding protein
MQLIMNLDAYNGLPSDARALVDRAVADAEAEFWEMSRKEEKQMIETMKMKGATLIYPSHEEMARWEAAIAPYYAKLGEKYGAEWTQLMNIREKLK